MLQAPRDSSPCSSIEPVEPAGSGAKGAVIDPYGLQLKFGLQEVLFTHSIVTLFI